MSMKKSVRVLQCVIFSLCFLIACSKQAKHKSNEVLSFDKKFISAVKKDKENSKKILDSLYQNGLTSDSVTIFYYKNLALYSSHYDSYEVAIKDCDNCIQQAIKLDFKREAAKCLHTKAMKYEQLGKMDSCLIYENEALELTKQIADKKLGIKIESSIAYQLSKQGKYNESNQLLLSVLPKVDDSATKAMLYGTLANNYNVLNSIELADKYFVKAIQETKKIGNNKLLSNNYSNYANFHNANEDHNLALKYCDSILLMATDSNALSFYNVHKFVAYRGKKNYDSADYYGRKMILLDSLMGNEYYLATDYNEVGKMYLIKKDFSKSFGYFKKAKQLIEGKDDYQMQKMILRDYVSSYMGKHNIPIRKEFEQYIAINDSIIDEISEEQIFDMEVKYQTAQKEAQIAEQQLKTEKQKMYTYAALGGVGLLLLLGGGGFAYNRQRQKRKELQKQQELNQLQHNMTKLGLSNLNNQINSHDFKNTLTAALNQVQEKAPESYQHISHLLKITESALYSDSFTDSLRNQFSQIQGLVQLSKAQLFEDVVLEIKNSVDEDVQIPRLLLKNLVENSLKHGIKGTNKNAKIEVVAKEENGFIDIQVKDTGKGLDKENFAKGKGISVYQELFDYFNPKNPQSAKLELKNIDNGALASVLIPVNYKYS